MINKKREIRDATLDKLPLTILTEINKELDQWQNENKVQHLWAGDASLWTNTDEGKWLGWLTIAEKELKELPFIQTLKHKIIDSGFRYLVVLGMGGSSLCPATLAATFGQIGNYPVLHVLDSTDPMQIRHLEESIDLTKTLFIVSSKSGGTLEPNIFKQYFYSRLQSILDTLEVGDHFIAITDPGTKLETIAKKDQFRSLFFGEPSIGGRYSALSNFGMVPAELMGMDVEAFLGDAQNMVEACAALVPAKQNPGVVLGVILGVCANLGKDKITLILSPAIKALGAWLEQLLAESTGKQGKGLIPIDEEPLGLPENYGHDRIFIYMTLQNDNKNDADAKIQALENIGHVVVRFVLEDKYQLAAEFFRWEMATAVAGSIIGINAFNQPDVEGSKVLAAKLISDYEHRKKIQQPTLLFADDDIQLYSDPRNIKEIKALLNTIPGDESLAKYLKAHLARIKPGDYVNLSAFIEMSEQHLALLQRCRIWIRDEKKVATCLGFGPRFLHSTGQAYKGGPNSGVFLQITALHAKDLQIPGLDYSFGLVIDAQAEADFEVLAERGRRVLRVHLGKDPTLGLEKLYKLLIS